MFITATTATRNFLGDLVHDIRSDSEPWRDAVHGSTFCMWTNSSGSGRLRRRRPVGILMSGMLSITLRAYSLLP